MTGIWKWLDFPGWWRTVTRPADAWVLFLLAFVWVLGMVIGALGICATHHYPEPF